MLYACGSGTPPPALYSLGGSIDGLVGSRLALDNNGSISTIGPAANGYTASLFTGLPNGTSYNVTVATQPTNPSQTCVVTNGKGTIVDANVTDISVTCTTTPARFLLAKEPAPCFASSTIDSSSGILTATSGSPTCYGAGFYWMGILLGFPEGPMLVDPQGKFLYMTIYGAQAGNFILLFAIDRNSGAPSYVDPPIQAPAGGTNFLALDPSGSFLFAANSSGLVQTYTVNSVSGKLTPTTTVSVQGSPSGVSVDPLERFVYVASIDEQIPSAPQSILTLSLDSRNGVLADVGSAVSTGASGNTTVWFAPHPSGKFLYAGLVGSNSFLAYSINPAQGALTPVSGSPFTAGNGSAAVDPSGKYLYVANSDANDISAYAIDAGTGTLTSIGGSPFATGGAPESVAIEPLGHFAYVSNYSGVYAYQIDAAAGVLTPVSGSPFTFAYGTVAISY